MSSQCKSTAALLESAYAELKQLASRRLADERPEHTLQATALVNEVSLKLFQADPEKSWHSRSHFVRVAAEAMRQILVDHGRARLAVKRGRGYRRVFPDDIPVELPLPCEELVAIHEGLEKLTTG